MEVKFRRFPNDGAKMVDALQNAVLKQMKEEGFEHPSWDEIIEWMGTHVRIVVEDCDGGDVKRNASA